MIILLFILLTLKTLIFMYNTEVVSHQIAIFLVSFLTILFVFLSIDLSNLRKKHWLAFSFYALVSIIMFIDVVYYGYFSALPSVSLLRQVDQITAVGDSIRELLNIKRIVFVLDLPLVYLYIFKSRKKYRKHRGYLRIGLPLCILVILLGLIGFLNKKTCLFLLPTRNFSSIMLWILGTTLLARKI